MGSSSSEGAAVLVAVVVPELAVAAELFSSDGPVVLCGPIPAWMWLLQVFPPAGFQLMVLLAQSMRECMAVQPWLTQDGVVVGHWHDLKGALLLLVAKLHTHSRCVGCSLVLPVCHFHGGGRALLQGDAMLLSELLLQEVHLCSTVHK